jgi:hypothetical protein
MCTVTDSPIPILQRRPRQAINTLGVQVMLIKLLDKPANIPQTPSDTALHLLHDTL